MKYLFLFVLFQSFFVSLLFATRISGVVRDLENQPLPFASITVKGTTTGTTANNNGEYVLNLPPGKYVIVCQYVGYMRSEKQIELKEDPIQLNFTMALQELSLAEVVITAGGEDPAYEIIRQAIKKRSSYENPIDSFTCEAYIKTIFKTRKVPEKFLGRKLEAEDKKEMGLDSAGKGIIFLSESLTRIAYKKPDNIKLEVLSGRQSGTNGFGFNFPTFMNFYSNNVNIFTEQLNPRGFVSPVSEGALNYYRYRYLGSFIEDGREVNNIQVIPRRKYEPLFSGIINIIEGDWRIHSLELLLTKESQLEIFDTVRISQIHMPVATDIWQVKDQVLYLTVKQFGIDATGDFLNVYNNYDLNPEFRKKYFNNVVVNYDTAVTKKTPAYWDSIRPVPLEPDEVKDYQIKDSTYRLRIDSATTQRTLDSLRGRQGRISVKQVFISGFRRSNYKPKNLLQYSWEPILKGIRYNTVEGVVMNLRGSVIRPLNQSGKQLILSPDLRYGFSNHHLNASASLQLRNRYFEWDEDGGNSGRYSLELAGGKRVTQFNKENPIGSLQNTITTLLYERNYMKIYENYFGRISYSNRSDFGLLFRSSLLYEDRLPIDNTTDFTFFDRDHKVFTPNFPVEKLTEQFKRHQAVSINLSAEFQPGIKYIQYPRTKVPLGSRYPTFTLMYEKGIKGIAGSDVDYDKWKFSIKDDLNLKLRGKLQYRLALGGFINERAVFIQDFQHFNGNRLLYAGEYLNSFQLAPYYANSTAAPLYAQAHLEHHFNGMLTNKIPLFRRLNWNLVGGANAFYVNTDNNYAEVFAGIENIFKILRVDIVAAYLNGRKGEIGFRIGFGGLIGSAVEVDRK